MKMKFKIVFLGDSITEAGVYDKQVGIDSNGELVYPNYTGFITFCHKALQKTQS